jgi:hypothetical protein
MADALTLLLLMAMILSPVGLLTVLATRCAPRLDAAQAPLHRLVHYRYRGQPIR